MFRSMFRAWPLAAAVVLLAPAARAAEAPEVRLGRDVVPVFQSVRLKLDADKRSYSGMTHTDLDVRKPTNVVRLHADGQKLVRVSLVQNGDTLAVERQVGDHGLLTLTAAKPLKSGKATLDIEFTALFGTRAVGLYRVVTGGKGYAFTQFEAVDARQAFPCWDEPSFKFPYQLTLEVPAAHEAVSNTPIERISRADGWKTVVFRKTPPLPSYLLALATGPLEYTDVPGCSAPARIVTVQGQKALVGTTAAMLPKILGGLERWFGTPYPFAKLDLIAVPEFAYGAMENPGAITFRDGVLLLDPANLTTAQRRNNASVVCHELAHQWFGDLVTMAWWDDLWLNESFADWMAAKVTDEVYPAYKAGLEELQGVQGVLAQDTQPSTQAIRDSTTSSSAGLANVGLVYKKGNAVLSMFEGYLGPEVFQRGVRSYLKAHAWGNATAGDLWQALDAASGQDISRSMATFTDQPGVPMLRVVPEPDGVRITQSRATPYGVAQPANRWRVPLAMRWSDGATVRTQRLMLTDESQFVKLTGARVDWVIPNASGTGYYAWSVPDAMLEKISQSSAATMSPAERVAFIGDLGLLLNAGDLRGDAYLRALTHLGSDPEPLVVQSVMGGLGSVQRSFVPDSMAGPFAAYVRATLGPALDRFGLEKKPGEEESVGLMRGDLVNWLARRGDDPRARAWADAAAKRFLADSTSVDPAVVETVLNLAARRGDATLFDLFRTRFEATQVPALRARYLGTLGAFEDTTLESRALRYMLSDAVRGSESMRMLMGFRNKNEAAGRRLFEWMMANYDGIAARVPPPALRFMPMMGSGCSEARLKATEAFYSEPEHALPGIEQILSRVSDSVHECISLREREGPAVNGYLKSLGAK